MARKIFVSYKYSDDRVRFISRYGDNTPTTARHYVDSLQARLDANDEIYKGEDDGEDLSNFKEENIESRLKDRIFDSTITIVLISKNMKNLSIPENDQWIPWEVSYSLKEIQRNGRTSLTNAMMAVVIPDENGSYEYFIETIGCTHCGSVRWRNDLLFNVLRQNMFNRKQPKTTVCTNGVCGLLHTGDDHSYIYPVKWDNFILNVSSHLDHAVGIKENIDDYDLTKVV
jgi:hypothetical protein